MKIKVLAFLLLCSSISYGGTISRTNYVDGQTISASLQNSNENTIVTEINGLLDSANIEDGTLTGTDMAAGTVQLSNLASVLQSTFSYVMTLGSYKRPRLEWVNRTTVNISTNTGTTNQTCIQFPDERRCVTENVLSTSVNRQAILTEAASLSGTKNSGLRSGYVLTNNTFYGLYAVKDDGTAFVIVADTITPSASTYSTLNSAYGTDDWVYLGVLPYGNFVNNHNSLPNFKQAGDHTVLLSSVSITAGFPGLGICISSGSSGTAGKTWPYSTGHDLASRQIPANIYMVDLVVGSNQSGGIFYIATSNQSAYYVYISEASQTKLNYALNNVSPESGFSMDVDGSSGLHQICISGYRDSALAGFISPPF